MNHRTVTRRSECLFINFIQHSAAFTGGYYFQRNSLAAPDPARVVLLKSALNSSHLAVKKGLATSQRECQSRWAGLGETSDNRGHSPVLPPRQLTAYRSTRLQHASLAVSSASLWTAIGMASAKDTATFFTHGTCQQYEQVLGLYQQALRLKAERKAKKPEELIKLDNW